MVLKRINKSIAIALVGIMCALPMMNSVHAYENSKGYDVDGYTENVFKNSEDEIISEITSEDNSYKLEFNETTGVMTHIYYNANGEVSNSYSTNYYENLEKLNSNLEESKSSNDTSTYLEGPTIYTNKTSFTPDMLQLKIKSVTKNGKKVHQIDAWDSKNKYKQRFTPNYLDDINVKNFDKAINNASSKFSSIASITGATAAVAIIAAIGIGTNPGVTITVSALIAILKKLGFNDILNYTDTLVARFNNYSTAVKNGNHKYNAIVNKA